MFRFLRRDSAADTSVDVRETLSALGPDGLEVHARTLAVGSHLAATLVVTGYPSEVVPGWLDPLLTYPGRLDVALHIEPVASALAAQQLKKQRARLESSRRTSLDNGRLDDPDTEAAAADAAELAYRIARGEGKLFRLGLYMTIYGQDVEHLADEVASVRSIAESLLVTTAPATYRALPGWLATLPLGLDTLKVRRTFDTEALAACFPFASPDLPADIAMAPGGVLYGLNTSSGSMVLWDRFAQDNYNSVLLARSGAGKSYLTKLELLRQLFTGCEAMVIDPEDEYLKLAESVGGTVIRLGDPAVRLNPFDLPPDTGGEQDALTRRVLFLHTFLAVLLGGELAANERSVLDRAVLATYRTAGITADRTTHTHPAPLLADLAAQLTAMEEAAASELCARLDPYVNGSHRQLFAGPTTTRPTGHLVVFALREIPDELKTASMLLALDVIWRQVAHTGTRRRRLVVVDEAWLLMRDGHGANFLFRMAKAARKHFTGLAVITQDADDVLASELGRAIVSNAATQLLMRQSPQAIDQIGAAFRLSRGERHHLLSAPRGCALLLSGRTKVSFSPVASEEEHSLITTDPVELQADAEATADEAGDPYGLPDLTGIQL
ncbi:VirB4 family type IV secretion system protein [Streptomyces sp. ISL-100]|uniref:VirB4 family type IV secretion system protein n=1 Tax=Streptomyces sp. ISL-100 TaxID=2819173 RepID=UPI001BEBCE10|nr:ATP-binding protein [Streptomyces sp. ISL-100]MBT2396669.1 ATP-binding protein [Streptomyces sp. ISL-100]